MKNWILKLLLSILCILPFGSYSYAGFLYVLQDNVETSNQIHGFRVDETNGSLTALTGFPVASNATAGLGDAGPFSQRLAYDSTNGRLYVLNAGSNTISAFAVNPVSGALTALPHSPINLISPVGTWTCLAVHPSGSPLVLGDSEGGLHPFNVKANSAIIADGSPFNAGGHPFSLVFDRTGNFVYAGGDQENTIGAYSVNTTSGVLTATAGSPFDTGAALPLALTTDSSGRLFTSNSVAGQVRGFTLLTSGALNNFENNPFTSGLVQAKHGVQHPNGFYMVSDFISNQIAVFQVSGTGAATTLASVTGSPFNLVDSTNLNLGGTQPSVLALNTSGNFLFAANGVSRNIARFSVNATTGVLSGASVQNVNTLGTTGFITGMVHSLSAPRVTAVVPNRVSVSRSRTITVIGTDLDSLTTLSVAGVAASNLSITNSTTATFLAPAVTPAGFKNLETTFQGQTAVLLANAFRYVDEVTRNLSLSGGTTVDDFNMFGLPLTGGTAATTTTNAVTNLDSSKSLTQQFLAAKDFNDDTVARIFRFNGSTYDEGLNIPLEDFTEGFGFWGIFAEDLNADFTGGDTNQLLTIGDNLSPDPPIMVLLHPGWNQVSPGVSGVQIALDLVFVSDGAQLIRVTDTTNTLTNKEFFKYTKDADNPYEVATVLNGTEAYWLFSFQSTTLLLLFGDPNQSSGGLGITNAVSPEMQAFLSSDPSETTLPASVKYAMTGNTQGILRAITNADEESLTPPAPPAGFVSTSVSGTGGSSGGGGSGCFIATAAYGSPFIKEVEALREFRDDFLVSSEVGQSFIKTYYANSPIMARSLDKNRTSKVLVRKWLRPITKALK